MNATLLNRIVEAVLYEGHILYPYRPSSKKNQQRFTFGRVYPETYSIAQNGIEPCLMQTECLARARAEAALRVTVKFLQPVWREIGVLPEPISEIPRNGEPQLQMVPKLELGNECFHSWQETVEREIALPPITFSAPEMEWPFSFPESRSLEAIRDEQGLIVAAFVRSQKQIKGVVQVSAGELNDRLHKISVRILNRSFLADASLNEREIVMQTCISTHTILNLIDGEFISLLDPPEELKEAAKDCKNIGTFPVLVGDEEKSERDTMLSSPIILYDYPQIAPESAGTFFDGTEIDEMLTLRVMTMTDAEKREMRQVDEQARRLLERTQTLDDTGFKKMHGAIREMRSCEEIIFGGTKPMETAIAGNTALRTGDRVRIAPKSRADIMDIALRGRIGVIEAIEQDAEGKVHLALVLEDDPGKELGMMRQPGHRFFFGVDEIETLDAGCETRS